MTEQTNLKLLYEAINSIIEKNDSATASRRISKVIRNIMNEEFAKQESEEEYKVSDLGDDFSEELIDDMSDDIDETFDGALIAVDELQDMYDGELTDEIIAKFDAVRDAIDELKVADEDTEADACEELKVAVEDIKGDFEIIGKEDDEEVSEKFEEILELCGDDEDDNDEDGEEEEEIEVETIVPAKTIEEGCCSNKKMGKKKALKEDDEVEEDISDEDTEEVVTDFDDVEFEDIEKSDDKTTNEDDDKSVDELVDDALDANKDLEKLLSLIDEKTEKEDVDECWTKKSLPRNKLKAEEAGVKTSGMKFPKPIFNNKVKLGITDNNSAGKSVDVKTKKMEMSTDARRWEKVKKPTEK